MKLSERLQLIADEINKGETMADIGTDHGFLPLYLLETGKCPHVVMADISSGSLKKAEDNCRALHPEREYESASGQRLRRFARRRSRCGSDRRHGGLLTQIFWNGIWQKVVPSSVHPAAEKSCGQTETLAR